MKCSRIYESTATMHDYLSEALDIIREVRENMTDENGAPIAGYKRICASLDKALKSAQSAADGIRDKGYPDMEDAEEA